VRRILLALGSLALVAMMGLSLVGPNAGAQEPASAGTESQTTEPRESLNDAYLATLAEKLGISTDELQSAIDATNRELGRGDGLLGGDGFMGGKGPRGGRDGNRDGGRGGMREHSGGAFMRGLDFSDAAAFLGITEEELETELQTSTFLEIAKNHGKTTDDVRAFLIAQVTAIIDERLQAAENAPAGAESAEPAGGTNSIPEATEVPSAPALTPTTTA
jgi:hypothetical protein